MTDKRKNNGNHPNSLKNLRSFSKGEDNFGEEARAKSIEARKHNAEERKAMQNAVRAFQDLGVEVPDSETVMKIAMAKAIAANDMDEATRLATLLMPYEKPKLAAQDISVSTDVGDKSDEELAALAKEFGLDLEEKDLN